MKTKIKHIGKRSLAILMAIMMLVSIMLVGMVSVNAFGSVYLTGPDFGNWQASSSYALTKIDDNHFKGTFTIPGRNTNYEFKVIVDGAFLSFGGYWFKSDVTGGEMSLAENKNPDQIVPCTTSGDISITVEYYKQYGNANYLSVTQTATKTYTLYNGNNTLGNFTKQPDGKYTFSTQLTGGSSYSLCVKDNNNTMYSNNSEDLTSDSKAILYKYDVANNNYVPFIPSQTTNYTFTWDYTDNAASGTLSVSGGSATTTTAKYAIGGGFNNNWNTYDSDYAINTPVEDNPNVFYRVVEVTGETYFKIFDSNNACYAAGNYNNSGNKCIEDYTSATDFYTTVSAATDTSGNAFYFSTPGTYRIYVDQSGATPKVWVTSDLADVYMTDDIRTHFSDEYQLKADEVVDDLTQIGSTVSINYTDYSNYYSFVLTDNENSLNPEFAEYTVLTDKNNYCSFNKSYITTTDGDELAMYYVKAYEGCTNVVIHFDHDAKTIYATAEYDKTSSSNGAVNTSTLDDKKVTYYFAVRTEDDNDDGLSSGIKIKYWNNSTGAEDTINANTPVYGNTDATKNSNSIYINANELYNHGGLSGSSVEFKIYSAQIPVWATSFAFANNSGVIPVYSTGEDKSDAASLVFNPNRVYLYYSQGSTGDDYAKGVVLDDSLWQNPSSNTNEVKTKTFTANAVNYNTSYNNNGTNNGALTGDFNTTIESVYPSNYKHPLYFGYFPKTDTASSNGLNNFIIWDNLAMRNSEESDDRYYYASVQDLAGNKLSSSKNAAGYGKLLGCDNSTMMPLFDYESLASNTNLATAVYQDLDFPFYESTFNGVTTYSYDSTTDRNRVVSSNNFVVSNEYAVDTIAAGSGKTVGYYPFGSDTYGFSTEFDIDFYMTSTGKLKTSDGNGQDIKFNFSGDDDVWVYVDGVLVLDLGGSHKISAGSINFTDMKVYYKSAIKDSDKVTSISDDFAVSEDYVKTIDLAKLLSVNGVNFDNKDSSTKHTLQMFYMERGCFNSNCSISFNLPQNSGLKVSNLIDTSAVNSGLVSETLKTANNDYFSYNITNTLDKNNAVNSVNTKFGTSLVAASALLSDYLTTPVYPVETTEQIERTVQDTSYILALANQTTGTPSATLTVDGNNNIDLSGVNYTLSDANSSSETDASGQISGDDTFNLLYGQSANFESKITPNTILSVKQNNSLNSVNSSDNSAITAGSSDRKVSDYYTTSYTITDDISHKTIGSGVNNVGNASNVVADDSSDLDDSFYFANYSNDTENNTTAMTVEYSNTPAVGEIVITKQLDSANATRAVSSKFTFNVEFSNIFGGNSVKSTYENLVYTVYSTESDFNARTNGSVQYYGNTGITIAAGQYAVISGVPVGTNYTVSENSKFGYKLKSISGIANNGTNTVSVSDNVVSSNIPLATDNALTTITAVNELSAIAVNFKYYDREVVNGTPAHIDTEPTVYTKSYATVADIEVDEEELGQDIIEYSDDGDGEYTVTSLNTANLITAASTGVDVDNVIDEYKFWTSQADAVANIQTFTNLHTGNNYTADTTIHTDCYGNVQNSGENWVTYYDKSGKKIAETDLEKNINNLASITVWYFNQPKQYTLKLHIPGEEPLTSIGTSGYYYGNETFSEKAYYNIRIGKIDPDDSKNVNDSTDYLEEYGITNGYTGNYPEMSRTITTDDGDLTFRYWSYDAQGKSIASTKLYYAYRITRDLDLYAIYGDSTTSAPGIGLTVYANTPDSFFDVNGVAKTRLNTVMNPYGCPDSDENIKQVAVIYVKLDDIEHLTDDQISQISTQISDDLNSKELKLGLNQNIVTVTVSEKDDKGDFEYVYDVKPKDEVTSTSSEVYLTTKNRVQFSTTFKTESLAEGKSYNKLLTFAAMKYYDTENDTYNWYVSDNCVKYVGGEAK